MVDNKTGKIVQIIGAVIDVQFEKESLPPIYAAVKLINETKDGKREIVAEVEQHLGDDIVRCVALDSTDGLRRGDVVINTGKPITVPVGKDCLGRLFNLLGEPIDEIGPVKAADYYPIHREPPLLSEQDTTTEIFETGIKVIDLLAPYPKGGKVGLFGGAGVGKTVVIMELIRMYLPGLEKGQEKEMIYGLK